MIDGQNIKNTLGKNIKFFRFRKSLSQADLAERADISITFLSNIERGNKFPKAGTLAHLAKGLEIEVWELFKGESVSNESKELLNSFSEDITKNVVQILGTVYTQYLRKID
jgi:transcriptional regulator with XRE-family HTH domain